MAITIPIITEFADKGIIAAQSSFANFKNKVAEAEGGMGKFKAGANAAMDTVKANAGAMALAAGAAIAGFAVKAVNDFQKLAISIDAFRNTTGLTLDQSSQWVSYTGDLGIQAESMIKIFNRLGKAATDQLPAFKELGVEIAFGPDGAADLEKTFLRVNDAINSLEDPVKQAKYRADLFGRGWMDAAELINMSSTDIQASLAGVKDFEVIDQEEIQKAKDLRAAQDELGDALARISVELGEKLVPAFTNAARAAIPFLEVMSDVADVVFAGADANASYAEQASKNNIQMRTGIVLADKIFSWFGWGKDKTDDLTESTINLELAWKNGYRQMIIARTGIEDLGNATTDLSVEWERFLGILTADDAWNSLLDKFDRTKEAAYDALVDGSAASARRAQQAQNDLNREIAKYIDEIGTIPDEVQTRIIGLLEREKFDEALGILNQLRAGVNVPITGTVSGIPVPAGQTPSETRPSPMRPLPKIPVPRIPSIGAYSAGVTVNVAGSVISENDLVETVRKGLVNSQRNGAGLVYSNS